MNYFFQLVVALLLLLNIRLFSFKVTEGEKLPEALNYKPFSCDLCLTFWACQFAALSAYFLGFQVAAIALSVIAILNAIAMEIDRRKKTVTLTNTSLKL